MKPKGVTTQMNALDDYFLMVVFTLVPNRVHGFANFLLDLNSVRVKNGPGFFKFIFTM